MNEPEVEQGRCYRLTIKKDGQRKTDIKLPENVRPIEGCNTTKLGMTGDTVGGGGHDPNMRGRL